MGKESNGPEKSQNAGHPPNSKNFVFDDFPPLEGILSMRRGRKCDFFVRLQPEKQACPRLSRHQFPRKPNGCEGDVILSPTNGKLHVDTSRKLGSQYG
jgi:hypothetical protein